MFNSKDLIQMHDQISVSELLTLRSQSSRSNPFPFVSKDPRGCELQRLLAVCRQSPDLPGGVPTAHAVPEPIGLSSDYCPPQAQTGEWEAFAFAGPGCGLLPEALREEPFMGLGLGREHFLLPSVHLLAILFLNHKTEPCQ